MFEQTGEDLRSYVDLHAHLRGTFHPIVAIKMFERHRIAPPKYLKSDSSAYDFAGFEDFLKKYDEVGRCVRDGKDLSMITQDYISHCYADGVRHVELMVSPSHAEQNGLNFRTLIDSIVDGFSDDTLSSISVKIIITCVRHHGKADAIRTAELIAKYKHPSIVGFGLTGNENSYPVSDFIEAFQLAGSLGLGLTAHAGEWGDAKSVLDSVDKLKLDRIGHGINSVKDSGVLSELISRNIGFEVCISSNLALGAVKSLDEHPLRNMVESGCQIALCTDDPAYFSTSISNEYRIASSIPGVDSGHIEKLLCDAKRIRFPRETR